MLAVSPRVPDVGNQQPAAGAEYPHRFLDGAIPAGTAPDIVDRHARYDHVEVVVCQRKCRDVCGA
jgi:hypothetical protein